MVFSRATPDTSTLRNPTNIVYKGYGCYAVKLVVKNNSGSDSLTDSNYICLDAPLHITANGNGHVCQGQQSELTITASGGNNYHWSTGATTSSITFTLSGIVDITYTIVVSDGVCSTDTTITIYVDTMPTIIFKGDTSICVGNNSIIYALPPPGHTSYGYSYLWNTGSTADSILVNGITPGFYTYYLNVTKGACVMDSSRITVGVNDCTGIENYDEPSGEVEIYPNPSNGQFTLVIASEAKQSPNRVEIYNVLGEKVYSEALPQSQSSINLTGQPNGVYLYRIITENGDLVVGGMLLVEK